MSSRSRDFQAAAPEDVPARSRLRYLSYCQPLRSATAILNRREQVATAHLQAPARSSMTPGAHWLCESLALRIIGFANGRHEIFPRKMPRN